MTVVGLDDTDSREGQCTTYVATRIAEDLSATSAVPRCLLVRCNPAVEHKTRGNAALAIHTDASPDDARAVASATIADLVDPSADAGLVVAAGRPAEISTEVAGFARVAVCGHHTIAVAQEIATRQGFAVDRWNEGRGIIGALAAIGAWRAFDDWTAERIAYRASRQRGTERAIDAETVAELASSDTWDTVDRGAEELLCAPRTPCPVLFGIRGETPTAVSQEAARVRRDAVSEPIECARTFLTNQGTDAHLQSGRIGALRNGYAYRIDGIVSRPPQTRRGGHVFFELEGSASSDGAKETVDCVAFEPTKRFRETVRQLHVGDQLTVCGEVGDGTLKLEKLALRERVESEAMVPPCPSCDRRMESAGADAGYRCRECKTTAPGRVREPIERSLSLGWHEVPPRARRHIAKPLVRGGFDAPVHVRR